MNWRVGLSFLGEVGVLLVAPPAVCAQTVVLEPFVVTATRTSEAISQIPASVRVFDSREVANTPSLTLDGALRSVPGFSLFRRSDSLSAHPTAQGVSLRGLGPNGASRTLVLLDGVPVNDPFGGWVAWSKLPRLTLDHVEVVRGGGATAWGNAALGGVVQLVSTRPASTNTSVQFTTGARSLAAAEFVAAQTFPGVVVELSGMLFSTGGFDLVAPEDRGPVDIPAKLRDQWLSVRVFTHAGPDTDVTASARFFSEHRSNGTPLQNNRSRDALGSVVIEHHPEGGLRWTAVVFAENEDFSSTFSSVNVARTAETPASNQFSVPASAWGFAWTATLASSPESTTTAGLDFRSVRSETNEDSGFSNGAFTRRRVAGGEQQIGGVFLLHSRAISETVRINAGLRIDRWTDTNGFRHETLIATGESIRSDEYPNRDGWELSPSAGVVWKVSPQFRLRASAQRAFRRPTLNELYRPFRVGSVITESNPDLRTESVDSIEAGLDWSRGPISTSVAIFRNELSDAVANITLVHGPGTFPGLGFIPAGGLGRQRLNLDRVVVQGVELSATIKLGESAKLTAEYLFSDATVRHGGLDPALDGKRLAQVPRHSATLSLEWHGPAGLVVTPRVRVFSRQFEDDENLLPLAAATIADLMVSIPIRQSTRLFLMAENIGNARVETGRSAAGVTNVGAPRTATFGVRVGL